MSYEARDKAAEEYGIERTAICPGEHHALIKPLQQTTASHFSDGWDACARHKGDVIGQVGDALKLAHARTKERDAWKKWAKKLEENFRKLVLEGVDTSTDNGLKFVKDALAEFEAFEKERL